MACIVTHDRMRPAAGIALSLAAAAALFWLAYSDGGYATATRAYAGVTVFWAVAACAIAGGRALAVSAGATAAAALLAAFAGWTLASVLWAPDAQAAFEEFARLLIYVAVLVLASALASVVSSVRLVLGLALAVGAIAVVGLVSRLFPGSFVVGATLYPSLSVRLGFPVGYWNGLAIAAALGMPLALGMAVAARSRLVRCAAVVFLPVFAADIYLASSRGGALTALLGLIAFAAISRSWRAAVAVALAGAVSGVTVVVLSRRPELANGPLGTATATSEGHRAALLLALVGAAAALAWLAFDAAATHFPAPPSAAGWVVATAVAIAVVVVVATSHPLERFHEFKRPPDIRLAANPDFVRAHLLSTSGSGRWQFWQAAVAEFRAHFVFGDGAGGFESWWAQRGTLPVFVRDAHSLYLQVAGELGIVGLLLISAFISVAVGAAIVGAARATEIEASAAATGVAFAFAAGIDWIWELPGVTVIGIAALGIALGAAKASFEIRRRARLAVAAAAVVALVVQAVVLLPALQLRASANSASHGDVEGALGHALDARALEPWAPAPYTQYALVAETAGEFAAARAAIDGAILRSPRDWRLWLIAARLDTRRGDIRAARTDLAQMRNLNPRSLVFSSR